VYVRSSRDDARSYSGCLARMLRKLMKREFYGMWNETVVADSMHFLGILLGVTEKRYERYVTIAANASSFRRTSISVM